MTIINQYTLEHDKTTPGTHRYGAMVAGRRESAYISKQRLKELGIDPPSAVRVTIETVEEDSE